MILSCAIDAQEGRVVAVTDNPGDSLNANMEETTHMLSEGEIAELIIKLVLTMYRKHIQESKKESICYCQTHYNSGA